MLLFILIVLCNTSYSAGIATHCAKIELSNLKIGQAYSLSQLLGYPYSATYNGDSMVKFFVSIEIPKKDDIYEGFEPIPEKEWLKIEKNEFSLDPGQTAETDIAITIPNDEKYLGKKYLAIIYARTGVPQKSGPMFAFSAAIRCRFLLEIAAKPPTPEEARQLKKQSLGGTAPIIITPDRIFLNEIIPGKEIDLKKEYGETIKIVNSTDFDAQVIVESDSPKKYGVWAPVGYDEAEDPKWLKIKNKKIKVNKNTIKEVPLSLFIPQNKKKGSYFFVISVEVNSKIRAIRHLVRIYVDFKKENAHPQ